MGLILCLIWDDRDWQEHNPCPHEPSGDCFKRLVYYLFYGHIEKSPSLPDLFGMLADRFDIDVRPLEKIFNPNKDDYPADWDAKAQPPDELIDCLEKLIQALDTNSEAFSKSDFVSPSRSVDTEDYERCYHYLKGDFQRELDDLRILAEWARENGQPRILLYLG